MIHRWGIECSPFAAQQHCDDTAHALEGHTFSLTNDKPRVKAVNFVYVNPYELDVAHLKAQDTHTYTHSHPLQGSLDAYAPNSVVDTDKANMADMEKSIGLDEKSSDLHLRTSTTRGHRNPYQRLSAAIGWGSPWGKLILLALSLVYFVYSWCT